jgi:hypothetical protein
LPSRVKKTHLTFKGYNVKGMEFVKFTLCVSKVPFAKSQSPLLLPYFCQVDFRNLGSPYYPFIPSMFQLAVLSPQPTWPNPQVHLTPWSASSCPKKILSCPLPEFVSGLPIGLPPKKPFPSLSLSPSQLDSPLLNGALSEIKNVFIFLFLNILRAKGIHENSGYLKMK